jgi:hypothetical protein
MTNAYVPSCIQDDMKTLHDSDRVINVSFADLNGDSILDLFALPFYVMLEWQ